ncbi:HAD family hydrolase [Williamsia sterculiae]|nr:HAD family phosphatase [Williamsia sterculiae]
MPIPTVVEAVVFDCDGLLLDTETCWSRAEAALFAEYGHEFGPPEKDLLIGRTLGAACANMAEYFGLPGQGPALQRELMPLVEAELGADVQPMPGAVALLELLAGRVPLGIATNSTRSQLTAALQASGLGAYFDISVTADDVTNPKPDPDLYLRAFELLSASANRVVALEDSVTGATAARASGAFLITVPSQVGKCVEADHLVPRLDDPSLTRWASAVVGVR